MPENPDELTLVQVLEDIGWTNKRSAMNRYLESEEVRMLLGATQGRSPRYPRANLWLFRALRDGHDSLPPRVAPRTAAEFLRKLIADNPGGAPIDGEFTDQDGGDGAGGDGEDDEKGGGGGELEKFRFPGGIGSARVLAGVMGSEFAGVVIQQIKASGLLPEPAPVEDRLIDREAAAELLGLQDRPQAVGRRVPPVEPGLWSRVMVLRHIEEKRERAEAKIREREERRRERAGKRKPAQLSPADEEGAGDGPAPA